MISDIDSSCNGKTRLVIWHGILEKKIIVEKTTHLQALQSFTTKRERHELLTKCTNQSKTWQCIRDITSMGYTDYPSCRRCGNIPETTKHFLFYCSALYGLRSKWLQSFYVTLEDFGRIPLTTVLSFITENKWLNAPPSWAHHPLYNNMFIQWQKHEILERRDTLSPTRDSLVLFSFPIVFLNCKRFTF